MLALITLALKVPACTVCRLYIALLSVNPPPPPFISLTPFSLAPALLQYRHLSPPWLSQPSLSLSLPLSPTFPPLLALPFFGILQFSCSFPQGPDGSKLHRRAHTKQFTAAPFTHGPLDPSATRLLRKAAVIVLTKLSNVKQTREERNLKGRVSWRGAQQVAVSSLEPCQFSS